MTVDFRANYPTDILSDSGVQKFLKVGTTAIEAKVGELPLVDRKILTVFNNSNGIIYYGYNKNLVPETGTPIFPGQPYIWNINETVRVYLVAETKNNNVRVTEVG